MELEFPIHHVIVIGFHHKKGCQIEFAYPAFDIDIEKTAWRHLPTLAMPDGAHNFATDTVYFHLPSLKRAGETVFGVACFQQIDAEKVKNKGDEVTRSTIQKSVCVLSKYPLYGHIQVKMSLITAAYFREGDFAKVSILEEAYHNLNACLTPSLLETPETFVGLSARDLVLSFRHEVLILVKCLLLEKRILFRGASVGPLCSSLLTLVSLLPLTLEYGLGQSACVKTSKTMSIVPQFSPSPTTNNLSFDELLAQVADEEDSGSSGENNNKQCPGDEKMDTEKPSPVQEEEKGVPHQPKEEFLVSSSSEPKEKRRKDLINSSLIQGSVASRSGGGGMDSIDNVKRGQSQSGVVVVGGLDDDNMMIELKSPGSDGGGSEFSTSSSIEKVAHHDIPDFLTAVQMTADDAGLPLCIFTKGYLCHPYLSLHYMDLLSDSGVRGFLVGATNILFKQKRDLFDVIVEMSEGGSIEISDPLLKKVVSLTTEDLRFTENIVRNVLNQGMGGEKGGNDSSTGGDNFLDGVGWEGGDEWIRAQFKYYLMCLMRTSQVEEGGRLRDCFGSGFLSAWQLSHSWKVWNAYINSEERDTPGIYLLSPGHPYSGGQISVADMKLRLAHSMQRTEGGKKFNQAVGKAVASTGKAMGGALTSAKGALSSWWTSVLTTTASTGVEIGSEDANNVNNTETEAQRQPSSTAEEEPKRQSVWFTS